MLPAEVLRQPKAGFAAPVDYWLAHDLRPLVDDLLSESQIRRRGLFRPEVVRSYVDAHRRGTQDWSMQIWQFLTLEIWMQLFLDGGARAFAEKTYARKISAEADVCAATVCAIDRCSNASTHSRMKQLLQDARTSDLTVAEVPVPAIAAGLCAGANRGVTRFRGHRARLGRVRAQKSFRQGKSPSRSRPRRRRQNSARRLRGHARHRAFASRSAATDRLQQFRNCDCRWRWRLGYRRGRSRGLRRRWLRGSWRICLHSRGCSWQKFQRAKPRRSMKQPSRPWARFACMAFAPLESRSARPSR